MRIASLLVQLALRLRRGPWAALAGGLVLAPAAALGCPTCYVVSASAGAGIAAALRSGILVLIVPPMLIFTAIAVAAVRGNHGYAPVSGPEEAAAVEASPQGRNPAPAAPAAAAARR